VRTTTSDIRFGPRSGKLLAASLSVILLSIAACGTSPPVQEMSDARQAIAVAREAGAAQHAPEDLRAAEDYLDSALRNLSHKDYALARDDAVEAKRRALAALASTEASDQAEPQP
jgi:hypothetical protein